MNERLQAFFEKKQQEELEQNRKERARTLLELGLYDKVYSPTNTYDEEYYMYEWDTEEGIARYYKLVPIEVTDEEYQEVKKYKNSARYMAANADKNTVASVLTVIAWITFVGGFIIGFIYGAEVDTDFSWMMTIVYWGVSFISGMMFLGFAEIIKLLYDIKNK